MLINFSNLNFFLCEIGFLKITWPHRIFKNYLHFTGLQEIPYEKCLALDLTPNKAFGKWFSFPFPFSLKELATSREIRALHMHPNRWRRKRKGKEGRCKPNSVVGTWPVQITLQGPHAVYLHLQKALATRSVGLPWAGCYVSGWLSPASVGVTRRENMEGPQLPQNPLSKRENALTILLGERGREFLSEKKERQNSFEERLFVI